ncbi:phosphonate ABC transporter substrate-binding protein [Pseudotabrizicola sediminis]|uniref:Phosphonate ABC transporter substrate-binding protein n=1 Tax=Pseudotabrizicola sediminis TaxID=2486418 RepID=A0ABY2KPZ5_9RHOB|nr:phosphonate ABC transporter substrate-binding protein [Pseudotabrizicola sediminis]TGD43230.1 phosphonate ABC transporter substrate-binding protein [Pseudotabrizicola sediminis]
MKPLLLSLIASTALAGTAMAQDAITGFNIGILGGENAQDRMTSNECFRKYVEEAIGVPVKLFAPADYDGVIQGLLGGTIDMAWLGPSAYAKVYLTNPEAVDVAMVKTNLDKTYTYYSIGFARADSGITSMDDMKGKVMSFNDPNSASGYLIPRVELPQSGYSIEPGEFYGDVKFTGGHEQTIVAVKNGDVDAGVTWADGQGDWEDGYNSGALRKASDAGLVDMNDLVEIWRSKPIPEGPIVLRRALPQDVKQSIIDLTMGLIDKDKDCTYNIAAGETAGFTEVGHDVYETMIEVRRQQDGM